MEGDHGSGLKQQRPPWAPSCSSSLAGCFPWPPAPRSSSSYTCGYCKREFRSAQALGGHMNVHRRDRARLRQCYAAYHPSPLPRPVNPTTRHRAVSPLPNLNFLPPHCAGAAASTAEPVVHSFFSTTTAAGASPTSKAFAVSLDLGIGVCGCGSGAPEEHVVDLELRLGCAWE
ncbi:hypothetical protein ACP70R_009230 [Stipagrostis hirtigluma subsp. patula]